MKKQKFILIGALFLVSLVAGVTLLNSNQFDWFGDYTGFSSAKAGVVSVKFNNYQPVPVVAKSGGSQASRIYNRTREPYNPVDAFEQEKFSEPALPIKQPVISSPVYYTSPVPAYQQPVIVYFEKAENMPWYVFVSVSLFLLVLSYLLLRASHKHK